jgi:hypothetical protein
LLVPRGNDNSGSSFSAPCMSTSLSFSFQQNCLRCIRHGRSNLTLRREPRVEVLHCCYKLKATTHQPEGWLGCGLVRLRQRFVTSRRRLASPFAWKSNKAGNVFYPTYRVSAFPETFLEQGPSQSHHNFVSGRRADPWPFSGPGKSQAPPSLIGSRGRRRSSHLQKVAGGLFY